MMAWPRRFRESVHNAFKPICQIRNTIWQPHGFDSGLFNEFFLHDWLLVNRSRNASVVVCFMSAKYQESANCMLEVSSFIV